MAKKGNFTVKTEGFKELGEGLQELSRATNKNVVRRSLVEALGVFGDRARSLAPVKFGDLQEGIEEGTKLTRRQKRLAGPPVSGYQEAYSGTSDPTGIFQEFGTSRHSPKPFMRPAWESTKFQVLENLKEALTANIGKAVEKMQRKAARLAAKMKLK